MAEIVHNSTDRLRKKSQMLLARVDKDSKRVNLEIKKLRSQALMLANYQNKNSQNDCIAENINLWKLRNDSSGISAVLHPDYFHTHLKLPSTSVSDTISSKKLTLTSKKAHHSRIPLKKPIKDCYCYSEMNRIPLRLSNAQYKTASYCRQCRSQHEFKPTKETEEAVVLSSPISCETFRRVRKIDYTPKSQFLRNVQHKIYELQNKGDGDCLRTCPRSTSYHKFMASVKMLNDTLDKKTMLLNEYNSADKRQEFLSSPKAPVNSMASEQSESSHGNRARTTNRESLASSRKQSKSTLRKIIGSRKERLESDLRPMLKSPTPNKRITQSSSPSCYYWHRYEAIDKHEKKRDSSKCQERTCQYLKPDNSPVINNFADQIMENLRTFREKNYFETHGSSHTLASSRSSGSLQQYLLNERLFPEPVHRIHRKDLVVTMPPCATTQKKRIHYFPRHVVHQEKDACNTNYTRKRRQNCPLTGHAIDLGVLKARPPLNSLALKYQKSALC